MARVHENIWVAVVLPSVLTSGILVKLLDYAAGAFRSMRAEKAGRETREDRLETEIAELKRIIYALQRLCLDTGIDRRKIPGIPGERPFTYLEDPRNPDNGSA